MGILDQLLSQMDGDASARVGSQLGIDGSTATAAITKALPMLLGALSRNARSGGADELAGAVARDHDGSVLDDLGGFLERGPGGDAGGILDHVFGGSRPQVEAALGGATRLDAGSAGNLLQMLAPLVMGALGRKMKDGGLDAEGLGSLLGREEEVIAGSGSSGLDLLTSVLDADGDGSIVDDLADKGKVLLGSLLQGR